MSSCQEHQNSMIKHFLLLSYEDWFYWLLEDEPFSFTTFNSEEHKVLILSSITLFLIIPYCKLCFNNHDIMRNCVDITQQDVSLGFVQKYQLRIVFLSNWLIVIICADGSELIRSENRSLPNDSSVCSLVTHQSLLYSLQFRNYSLMMH